MSEYLIETPEETGKSSLKVALVHKRILMLRVLLVFDAISNVKIEFRTISIISVGKRKTSFVVHLRAA